MGVKKKIIFSSRNKILFNTLCSMNYAIMKFLLLPPNIESSTKSILINTSQNLINYSHTIDILTFKHILKEYFKQPEENIFLFSDDELYRQYRMYNDDFILRLTNKTAKSFLNRCTLQDILLVLNGTHPLINFYKEDNILIYLCGHGSKEFLKFHDKTYLFPGNIFESLSKLTKKVNKIFIILDTCHAEEIIYPIDGSCCYDNIKNICIYVTSLSDEESYGVNLDESLGVYKIDEFMFSLLNTVKYNKKDETITDLFNSVTQMSKESTHKFLKSVNWKIKEFFKEESKDREIIRKFE